MRGEGFARFQHDDADQIDRDVSLDTEYFQTVFAYRPPLFWEDLWLVSGTGARLNVGSVNLNQSTIWEQIKLSTASKFFHIGLMQNKEQNPYEQRLEQEVSVSFQLPGILRFSALADLNSEKKFSDVGAGVSLLIGALIIKGQYWSVDHFYNSKEETLDRYEQKPTSQKLSVLLFQPLVRLGIESELDGESIWNRPSVSYRYSYSRERHKTFLELGPSRMFLRLWAEMEHKMETKDWFNHPQFASIGLGRQMDQIEAAASLYLGRRLGWVVGGRYFKRSTPYFQTNEWDVGSENIEETSLLRSEQGGFVKYAHKLFKSESDALRWAWFLDRVEIQQGPIKESRTSGIEYDSHIRDTPKIESKLQISFEFAIGKNGLLSIGNLLDLDEILDADGGKVSPNAGMNVQFQMNF